MEADAVKIRTALIEHVRKNGIRTLTYGELLNKSGTGLVLPNDRDRMSDLLTQIFEYEHISRRPLLTIVVVQQQSGMPGEMFFKLTKKHKLMISENDIESQISELKEVVGYWQNESKYAQNR